MKVLGIPGSLRRDSLNRQLLASVAELAPPGVELEIWDDLKAVPPFDEDDEAGPAPEAVERLRLAVEGADAVLFCTPEYNGSIPGQLKNALDWISRPHATNVLRNKPAAVVGASTGMFGAVWSQTELRRVLATIGARVVGTEIAVGLVQHRFDGEGRLADEELAGSLRGLVETLAAEAAARVPVAA
jgi:chromate reductase